LAPFKEAGRRVASSSVRAKASSGPRADLDDIRKWARENGHTVSDRGRVAQTIIDAYDAR
ncbi:histone-like nucleoid-structuring protein Lsr2, partial [Burkholderia sp. SIMBA_024]|uniref:Lsr2 family DNA-binding protein n=1 Tax=Burkholderia sp. SIMBA_024 TaxID=3085768 RepID=UPI00397A6154